MCRIDVRIKLTSVMDRSKNDIRLDVAMNANDWSKLAAVLVLVLVVAFLLLLCSSTNDTSFVLPLLIVAMDFTLLYIFLQAESCCSTEYDGFSMRIELSLLVAGAD